MAQTIGKEKLSKPEIITLVHQSIQAAQARQKKANDLTQEEPQYEPRVNHDDMQAAFKDIQQQRNLLYPKKPVYVKLLTYFAIFLESRLYSHLVLPLLTATLPVLPLYYFVLKQKLLRRS